MLNEMNRQVQLRLGLSNTKETIADLGCGMGGTMRFLMKNYPQLYTLGVTLSDFQVSEGNKLLKHTKGVIVKENYENTSFTDSSLDGAVAMESFCHSGHSYSTLKEAYRILKPTKKLVIADAFLKKDPKDLCLTSKLSYEGLCKRWSLDGIGVIDQVKKDLQAIGFNKVIIEDISLKVAPSVLHVPFAIPTFLMKQFFIGKKIRKQSWNNLIASFYSKKRIPMKKLIIAGGSGYLGTAIAHYFMNHFEEVVTLSRKHKKPHKNVRTVVWDAKTFSGWEQELNTAEVLINMTGRSVDCRYNDHNKKVIMNSRVDSTAILGQAIEQCETPPKIWFNSSTATIYRHSLDKQMDEASGEIGTGFSVSVGKMWEHTFFSSQTPETRKVALRTAIVLGKNGGALQALKKITKLGLGGKQGNGKQKFSWIHEEDFLRSIDFLINESTFEGPINIVSPTPTTNTHLMKSLRNKLKVYIGIPAPKPILTISAFLIRSETELLLKSRNVIPKLLLDTGFRFKYIKLENALDDLL